MAENMVSLILGWLLIFSSFLVYSSVQGEEFDVGCELLCKDTEDEPILVQYKTERLQKVDHVLPWRPILIWYCGNVSVINNVNVKGINYTIKMDYNPVNANLMPSIFIEAKDVRPDTEFWIDSKRIYVFGESKTHQIIIALNEWYNIQNKKRSLESGVFSMFGKNYKKYFEAYAQTIPFSQSTLLQLVPLGSFDITYATLSNEKSEIDARRKLSSNFVDLTYCGQYKQRLCYGGVHEGHSGYAYNLEGYYPQLKYNINLLLSNINAYKINNNGPNWYPENSLSIRTITSEATEYSGYGVKFTGLFANPPYAAYVGTKASEISGGSFIDNELPHELGHTYGLGEYSGRSELMYKIRDFQIGTNNRLVLPFFKNMKYKVGSMNGGGRGTSDEYFTSLSHDDKEFVERRMLQNNQMKIDSRVKIQNDSEDRNKYETVIVCVNGPNFLVYRINALIPTVLYDTDYIQARDGQFNFSDMLKITLFNDRDERVGESISYHVDQHMFALPQSFNIVLRNNGYLLIQRKDLRKVFFVRNDAIDMDPPVQGNRADIFKPIYDYTLKNVHLLSNRTAADITKVLENNGFDTNFLIEIPEDNLRNYEMHASNFDHSHLGKTLTIYNYGMIPFKVLFYGTSKFFSVPHQSIGYLTLRNGWQKVDTLSEDANAHVTTLDWYQVLRYFHRAPEDLFELIDSIKNKHLKVILQDDSLALAYLMVYPHLEDFLGATVIIKNESAGVKNVIIYKKQKIELQPNSTIFLECGVGWDGVVLPLPEQSSSRSANLI